MPTTQQIILGQLSVIAVGAAVLAIVIGRGLLAERTFDGSPKRTGTLALPQALAALGLWILSQVLVSRLLVRFDLMPPDRDDLTAAQALALLLGGQAGMALTAVLVLGFAATGLDDGITGLGLGGRRLGQAIKMALIAGVTMLVLSMSTSAAVGAVLTAMGHRPPTIAHETLKVLTTSEHSPAWWGLIASAVIGAPLLEEILFRGLLQTALLQNGLVPRRWLAIGIASFFFAGIHLGAVEPEAILSLFVLSLGLGYAYEKTGSLWASIGVHAIFNGAQILIALNVSPDQLPT